jgi:hypothetical protein
VRNDRVRFGWLTPRLLVLRFEVLSFGRDAMCGGDCEASPCDEFVVVVEQAVWCSPEGKVNGLAALGVVQRQLEAASANASRF